MNASTLLLATLAVAASAAAQEPPIVCMPDPIACQRVPRDRFDPAFQRFLVEQKLELQPQYWTTVYFYLPPLEQRELQELQIRYLAELLRREPPKQPAAPAE
jgi:hypothetical protein